MLTHSNKELQLALDYVERTSQNLFITGKAGTGKTTFLHQIKESSLKRLIVVAPTGVAAINAKGVTIHSFFQLPFGPIIPNQTSVKAGSLQRKFSKTKIDIIKSLDLVIIDEISMVRADVLDGIDQVLRRYKKRNEVFGGAQVIMFGDLQQLAPVIKPDEWSILQNYYKTAYFFSSLAYQKANVVGIELKHIYRQQDNSFISILNEVRNNKLSNNSIELLNKQYKKDFVIPEDDEYITLTTHNHKANTINQKELDRLDTESRVYIAEIHKDFNEKNFPNDQELLLKVGAQVMFIKNDSSLEKRYYNGKIGVITALDEDSIVVESDGEEIETTVETWENVKYSIDKETQEIKEELIGSYTQVPLRLAWAITIHKSQGLTFDKAIIDTQESFAHGQTYVALSRCKSLKGMVLKTPIQTNSIVNDSTVLSFSNEIETNQPNQDSLLLAEKEYQLKLLQELFNYYEFLKPLDKILDAYLANENIIEGNIYKQLSLLKSDSLLPLVKVGYKFKNQIESLLKNTMLFSDNLELKDRVDKGIVYFLKQTKEELKKPLEAIEFSTDNKEINKLITRNLSDLEELINQKIYCLEGVGNEFSIQKYLELRAKSKLLDKPKKKATYNLSSIVNNDLLESLRELRSIIANSENINHYQVFTQKSLIEMCQILPRTPKQLRKINGMGKVRVDKYGEEILDIINEYCNANNIEIVADEPELPKLEKKNTKDISIELYRDGLNIDEIALKRDLVRGTIEGHLTHFIALGELDINEFFTKKRLEKVKKLLLAVNDKSIKEVKEIVGEEYTYGELRMIKRWLEAN